MLSKVRMCESLAEKVFRTLITRWLSPKLICSLHVPLYL